MVEFGLPTTQVWPNLCIQYGYDHLGPGGVLFFEFLANSYRACDFEWES